MKPKRAMSLFLRTVLPQTLTPQSFRKLTFQHWQTVENNITLTRQSQLSTLKLLKMVSYCSCDDVP
jgi:hypothetical protein